MNRLDRRIAFDNHASIHLTSAIFTLFSFSFSFPGRQTRLDREHRRFATGSPAHHHRRPPPPHPTSTGPSPTFLLHPLRNPPQTPRFNASGDRGSWAGWSHSLAAPRHRPNPLYPKPQPHALHRTCSSACSGMQEAVSRYLDDTTAGGAYILPTPLFSPLP